MTFVQVPSNIWRLSIIWGLQATFFIWGKMLCCKKLLKKLHIVAKTVRSGLFKGKLDVVAEFCAQTMLKEWFQLYSARTCEFFECKSSLWMIFSLCGRVITCWQLWQMSRDEMGMSFLHCVKSFCTVWRVFLHCVKRFFALCEEGFCTVWRGFAYFV